MQSWLNNSEELLLLLDFFHWIGIESVSLVAFFSCLATVPRC